ncbi:UDP-3-O-(3-hydroxymyristoyl)glucosamine N-acyltransferase [Glaciecola sp. MH2013]|uniref:UDP-3-O-(3-hydroxymyristoyl)glucosamine N-acyltransferase n=1 Tax=Glaciecola sp. MH2013 TaxID=2785524 RepID=UPI00189C80F1|nr:UDP-3-O-(3-hydroxymyristoyl)glucosamine N-acyltransferase [Glaciecola sp. MH2013]MBF7074715.1 UDP-3-O-(3-hydroxymyristoyl)glucosamine N-acyltransferase [Glaciecola sp. MH2013]
MTKTFTLQEIVARIGGELIGNGDIEILSMATLEGAAKGQLSFLSNSKYKTALAKTEASAVILRSDDAEFCTTNKIIHSDPYVAFAKAAQLLDTTPVPENGISPLATIHESAVIGENASIAAGVVIERDVIIGKNAKIGANTTIGEACRIGDDLNLRANVSLYHRLIIGNNVSIHSGTVVGSDGFGYANDKGVWVKIPQTGSVVIGNDCEIGSNTSIDRGALDNTIIGNDVIIDNLVQIAHNVTIGDHSCICGGTGIAGSANIGKYVVVAGTCVINGHIDICDKVQVTGFSMVTKSITEPGIYSSGMPVQPNRDWQRNTVRLRQIDKLVDRVKALEGLNK